MPVINGAVCVKAEVKVWDQIQYADGYCLWWLVVELQGLDPGRVGT